MLLLLHAREISFLALPRNMEKLSYKRNKKLIAKQKPKIERWRTICTAENCLSRHFQQQNQQKQTQNNNRNHPHYKYLFCYAIIIMYVNYKQYKISVPKGQTTCISLSFFPLFSSLITFVCMHNKVAKLNQNDAQHTVHWMNDS